MSDTVLGFGNGVVYSELCGEGQNCNELESNSFNTVYEMQNHKISMPEL